MTLTYKVTGSASSIDITYANASGNTEQATNVAVPLRSGGSEGVQFRVPHGAFAYISAQNQGESGNLDCAIEADGVVINTGHAQGGYAIATCSTTVP